MHLQTGRSFLPITVKMEISRDADVRSILAWLTGSGDLITSDDPAKRYTAYACDTVSVSRLNAFIGALQCVSNVPPSPTPSPTTRWS